MSVITVRNVPESVKQALRIKAAENGFSLEESIRQMLAEKATDSNAASSKIGAAEIMRRAAELESDEPVDARYKFFSQKELSDAISGEYEGI